jgi:hypothetical protein
MVSQESNQSVREFKHPKRINDFVIYENHLIVGGDDGVLYFWNNASNLDEETNHIGFKAHTPRVKKIKILEHAGQKYLISCSTDGVVSIWDIGALLQNLEFVSENKLLEQPLKPNYELTTFQRIISLHVHEEGNATQAPVQGQNGNEESKGGEDDEDDDDEEEEDEEEEEQSNKKSKKKQVLEKNSKKIKKVSFSEPELAQNKKKGGNQKPNQPKGNQNGQPKQQQRPQQDNRNKKKNKKKNKKNGKSHVEVKGGSKITVEYD